MAYTYEKLVQGNYSVARISKVGLTTGTKKIATFGTATDFTATTGITPNPGAPAEISYVEKKTSRGVTVKSEQNNAVVKASDGTPAASGSEASLQITLMTSPAKREALAVSAKLGDIYAVMVPSGLLTNGAGVAGWYHILGKLTELSFGDLNDEDIQELTVTFTGVIGYSADTGVDYSDYNTAMTTATMQQMGYETTTVITPTAIVTGDFASIISGDLVAIGTVAD